MLKVYKFRIWKDG